MRVLKWEVQARLVPRFTLWSLKGRRSRSAGDVGSQCYGVTAWLGEGVEKFATEQEGALARASAT